MEVEVPSPEDALAIRRFALSRRQAPGGERESAAPPAEAGAEDLGQVLRQLDGQAREAVRVFAAGLAASRSPAMLARAQRVAANFADAAAREARSEALGGTAHV